MTKKEQIKKKSEQPDPIIRPPTAVYEPKKIRPRACLLLQTYRANKQAGYLDLRVKSRYYKQLNLSAETNESRRKPGKTVLQLFRVYSKMKYLYRLQIKNFNSKKWDIFYQTKLRRIREVKILLHTRYGDRYDNITNFAKDFKRLKRLNPKSLKIRIHQLFFHDSTTFSRLFTNIALVLKDMSNLKEFSLVIKSPIYGEQNFTKDLIISDNSSKFKKLQKLEKLSLVFQGLPRSLLDSFPQDFSYLKNLKSIKLVSEDEKHGKEIMGNLCKIKSLTSVTIYKFAEPNDILSLALEIPNLRSINIKDDWIFSSQDMPALKTIKEKGLDIIQLHIDVPLDIESDEDASFMFHFLTPFKEIRSLHLHIRSGKDGKYILDPIAKSINSLQKLEKLRIGLLARSPGISSQFLPCIESLKELREIGLVLKRECERQPTWDTEIKETYQGVKSFLMQSQKLKNVIIDWDHFSPKCAEHLKLIVDEMKDLDMFRLGYLTTAQYHGKVHEHVLRLLGNLFGSATTKIKNVTLATLCLLTKNKATAREYRERFKREKKPQDNDCSDIIPDVSKIVEMNKNIVKFIFDAGDAKVDYRRLRMSHPFFDNCL